MNKIVHDNMQLKQTYFPMIIISDHNEDIDKKSKMKLEIHKKSAFVFTLYIVNAVINNLLIFFVYENS